LGLKSRLIVWFATFLILSATNPTFDAPPITWTLSIGVSAASASACAMSGSSASRASSTSGAHPSPPLACSSLSARARGIPRAAATAAAKWYPPTASDQRRAVCVASAKSCDGSARSYRNIAPYAFADVAPTSTKRTRRGAREALEAQRGVQREHRVAVARDHGERQMQRIAHRGEQRELRRGEERGHRERQRSRRRQRRRRPAQREDEEREVGRDRRGVEFRPRARPTTRAGNSSPTLPFHLISRFARSPEAISTSSSSRSVASVWFGLGSLSATADGRETEFVIASR
jgi:hypothetical protein